MAKSKLTKRQRKKLAKTIRELEPRAITRPPADSVEVTPEIIKAVMDKVLAEVIFTRVLSQTLGSDHVHAIKYMLEEVVMADIKKYKETLADGTVVEVEEMPFDREKAESFLIVSEDEREKRPPTPEELEEDARRSNKFYKDLESIEEKVDLPH